MTRGLVASVPAVRGFVVRGEALREVDEVRAVDLREVDVRDVEVRALDALEVDVCDPPEAVARFGRVFLG